MIESNDQKQVTIHIDATYHAAMKDLAHRRKVLISLLYEQATEAFLDSQNKAKIIEKRPNAIQRISR